MPTVKTLTVAQLLVLTTAAQRPDHMVLPLPPTIRARGGAQRNLLGALLKMDLIAETSVDDASIAWRTDEAGQHHGLRITAAGLTAAGVHADATVESTDADADTNTEEAVVSTGDDAAVVEEAAAEQGRQEAPPRRPTGKLGEVLQAISAEAGATLAEITTLTGWLPHTARAAVTGLRKRGFDVALIRDKIAASKRKGMWMGGSVPLGYEVKDRKLVVHRAEAERVRSIYRAYLDLGAVRLVQQHLAEKGITGKGDRPLARGALFHLLQNRVYRGEVAHRGNVYPGEHEAIVEAELWKAVQRGLAESRADQRLGGNASHPSLLAGMLTDPAGEPMVPTHANKAGRRYRYYVSNQLITGTREDHADALRVPAAALERVVVGRIARLLSDGLDLLRALRSAGVLPADATQQRRVLEAAHSLARRWHQQGHAAQREILLALHVEVVVQRHEITIHLTPQGLLAALAGKSQSAVPGDGDGSGNANGHGDDRHLPYIALTEPVSLRRAGREMALLVGSTVAADRSDPSLVRLIARAWALREALVTSTAPSLTAVAAEQGISQSYATRLVRLAWLAPDIVEAILGGCQPANLTASRLMQDTRIPTGWQDQRRALGFV